MPRSTPPESISDIEGHVLRGLCGSPISPSLWKHLVAELKDYRWHHPEHKVIFDALTRIRTHDFRAMQAQLPAQTTRMGFPDVDWAIYLSGAKTPAPKIKRLVEKLKADTKDRS